LESTKGAWIVQAPMSGFSRKQTVRFRPKEDIEYFFSKAVIDLPVMGQALCQSGLDVLAPLIQRAAHVGLVRGDRRGNHRRFDILVAQQRLNGANVGARRQQMTGKTVPRIGGLTCLWIFACRVARLNACRSVLGDACQRAILPVLRQGRTSDSSFIVARHAGALLTMKKQTNAQTAPIWGL
jgi:hypothetical protein